MFKTQKGKIRLTFVVILLLSMAAFLVDFGSVYNRAADKYNLPQVTEKPFQLGLDLLGGTHLVYRADVSQISAGEQASAVEGVRDVIERRVNVFGLSEPNVQTAKASGDYNIIVELAGIKDINQAINMIGETPLLEFKEENTDQAELTPAQQEVMTKYNEDAMARAQVILNRVLSGEDFGAVARELSEDEENKDNGGDIGWVPQNQLTPDIAKVVADLNVGEVAKNLVADDAGINIFKLIAKRTVKDEALGLDKKEVKASHLLICYAGASGCEDTITKEEAREKIEGIKSKATAQNFAELVAQHSTEPGAAEREGDLGFFQFESMVEPFAKAAFDMPVGTISNVVETEFGFHLIYKQTERVAMEYNFGRISIRKKTPADITGSQDAWKNTSLTGKQLKRAMVQFNPNDGSPEIRLEFDSEGKDLFSEITKRNIGKPVAIFLDGEPISIPTVQQAITSGDAIITGRFTIDESKLLAQRLNAGALPIPIELVNQQTVGATLGQISVEKSVKAGVIGVLFVIIFMIAVYRLPGVLSVFSLGIYGLVVLAIFKLWPVTLTLAGLAGFVLSIGMAVDANVLIFARLKEELKLGKPIGAAIDEAFRRAWPSIRDGNISTLLTCFILIQFTTSIVKGFAVTLSVGVLISMFSAIVITKNLMQFIITEKISEKGWLMGVKKNKI
ncbi:MAG: protein translocase subunit SecD [bacterium]|nr:protein translocase subunit SecD [bacterium]